LCLTSPVAILSRKSSGVIVGLVQALVEQVVLCNGLDCSLVRKV